MTQIRLDRFLANAGLGTRSQVRELLKKGQIQVNGRTEKRPETKVDDQTDEILCGGHGVKLSGPAYYMLNKPAGYLSARSDARWPVVLDLLDAPGKERLSPVGRLDADTEGLLLLTDDGELLHRLLSPRNHVDKTYYARVSGAVGEEDCRRFEEGLDIGEKRLTMPARLQVLSVSGEGEETVSEILVTLHEGKFHQVKRMFAAVGKQVRYLKRISMGGLELDSKLEPGHYRSLTAEEIERLRQDAGKETGSDL